MPPKKTTSPAAPPADTVPVDAPPANVIPLPGQSESTAPSIAPSTDQPAPEGPRRGRRPGTRNGAGNPFAELDPELAAMAVVHRALEPLDAPARRRVLDYLMARFDISSFTINEDDPLPFGQGGETAAVPAPFTPPAGVPVPASYNTGGITGVTYSPDSVEITRVPDSPGAVTLPDSSFPMRPGDLSTALDQVASAASADYPRGPAEYAYNPPASAPGTTTVIPEPKSAAHHGGPAVFPDNPFLRDPAPTGQGYVTGQGNGAGWND
jgi:hypothetical protein